jgi:hypothetical protein
MSLLEAPRRITIESAGQESSPQKRAANIKSQEMQPRGVLVGHDHKRGEITRAEILLYRGQRLKAMEGDLDLLEDTFPGEFKKHNNGIPTTRNKPHAA